MMYPKTCFLRRAQTAWSAEDRLQGQFGSAPTARRRAVAARQLSVLEAYDAAEEGGSITTIRDRIRADPRDLAGPGVVVAHELSGQVLRGGLHGLDLWVAGPLPNDGGCVCLLENGTEAVLESTP